jgi:hypothetical protein
VDAPERAGGRLVGKGGYLLAGGQLDKEMPGMLAGGHPAPGMHPLMQRCPVVCPVLCPLRRMVGGFKMLPAALELAMMEHPPDSTPPIRIPQQPTLTRSCCYHRNPSAHHRDGVRHHV